MQQIATSAGAEDVTIGCLWIGGSTLTNHSTHALSGAKAYEYNKNTTGAWRVELGWSLLDALQDEQWDFIFLNQQSFDSSQPDTFGKSLTIISEYVRENMPQGCQLWWNTTWSYDATHDHAQFKSVFGSDPMAMYEAIRNTADSCVRSTGLFDGMIPNGTVIQNMRTSWVADFITADGYHMSSSLGCYAVGLGALAAMTDIDVGAVTHFPGKGNLAKKMKAIADEAVRNAMNDPFTVTESAYKER